jgi:hypothetical protein
MRQKMGIKVEVTHPDGSSEVHDGEDDTPDTTTADESQADADPASEAEATSDEEPADEVTVSIGDEAPPPDETERAPEWVRDLRKQHRELQKKVREYEAREQIAPAAPKPVVGPKPKLEDHDYDTDRYETALESWYRTKEQADKADFEAKRQAEEQTKAWQSKLDGYGKAKTELKVRDFDDAEHTVQQALNVTQQGVVLQGAENPALVVYALGKNPKKVKELAAITDPVKFAFAVAKLEAQLKVTPRTKPPAPERSLPAGTAPVSGTSDSTLERLREDASRTGDMTKVIRYKQQLKAKAR